MCGLSTVVTPAGASLTMYREIRSYANSIWDDNNNNIGRKDKKKLLVAFYTGSPMVITFSQQYNIVENSINICCGRFCVTLQKYNIIINSKREHTINIILYYR